MRTSLHGWVLAALAAVLFFANIGGWDLWRPDEPRYAQVAREMLQTGDFLVPRVNGAPYNEKPPLLFWLIAAASAPAGDVDEITARIPSALAGVATVSLTYFLGLRLFDRRRAFWAALILMTTPGFFWYARLGQIDSLLTACVTASLVCLWMWHEHRLARHLAGFYLAMAAAVLAKGPPGVVFPLLVVTFFYWGRAADRKGLRLVPGLLAVAALIAIWLIPARMGAASEMMTETRSDLSESLYRQTIGRFFLGYSHSNPVWYYLLQTPPYLFPWTIFLPWTFAYAWKNRAANDSMRFILAWIIPAFVFFSLSSGKRSLYLLPLYPAYALILSASIVELADDASPRLWRSLGFVWTAGLFALATAALFVDPARYAELWSGSSVSLAGAAGLLGLHAGLTAWRCEGRRIMAVIASHTWIAMLLASLVVFPAMNTSRSIKAFCEPLRQLSERDVNYDLYSSQGIREEYIFYAHHRLKVLFQPLPAAPGAAIDVNAPQNGALREAALNAIEETAENQPIESLADITPEALEQLEAAVARPPALGSIPPDFYRATIEDLRMQLAAVMESPDKPAASFYIVRDVEWRWILAVYPEAAKLKLVHSDAVGGHERLLYANDAGFSLLK